MTDDKQPKRIKVRLVNKGRIKSKMAGNTDLIETDEPLASWIDQWRDETDRQFGLYQYDTTAQYSDSTQFMALYHERKDRL